MKLNNKLTSKQLQTRNIIQNSALLRKKKLNGRTYQIKTIVKTYKSYKCLSKYLTLIFKF